MEEYLNISIGILLALLATFCFSLGFVFQKKGLLQGLPKINFDDTLKNIIKSFYEFFKNKVWITGFLLGIIGWFPFIIAVSYVGIIIVQPVTSLGLIIFLISSVKLLNEKVSKLEVFTAILLSIAPILIAFSKITNIDFDLDEFLIPFLMFLILSIFLSFIFFFLSKIKKESALEGILLTIIGVILSSIGASFTNIFTQALNEANINLISLFGWSEIVFGIFWFDTPHIWLFCSFWGLVIFFMLGILFYQSGFQRGKASVIYLIINSLSVIIPIFVGFAIFQQTLQNYYIFFIALGIIIFSVIILSKFQAKLETFLLEI
ncbi:MAG: hypothetical protein KGD63_14385 [Candidatus Lokiarchaeota archaeon]|nr:hypothetical protein [Candidatus Lokiarchaeota archaeon]